MKEVHVAVAAIQRGGRVLIARRPDHVHQGGLLEFPGGKVEPGETVQQALLREIDEETGLRIPEHSLQPVIAIRHDYGDKRVLLDVWRTLEAEGDPVGREGQPIDWLPLEALRDDEFPMANRPIIRALRLSDYLAISGVFTDLIDGLHRFERQLDMHRPEVVMLRAPWLGDSDYRELALGVRGFCQEMGTSLILHGAPQRLEQVAADGIHLPWSEAQPLTARPVPDGVWLGVSCHNEDELAHAVTIGADYVTLGPVKATLSHPDASPMDWSRFQALVAQTPVPVFGLGGLAREDAGLARQLGGQGVAGIGSWW
ncbi:Nudix family hydrolase [Marinobacter zhejiangensis]|uniref:8-oxo-dGTP diphosphatase n=1 Tax=Marinobacter zhejiangensis TaxID=488535 RepID=A0A1I4TC63_9GAMM|nr:Nudix family hydrolase [Marinobacter zhejiangensis]SFM74203.1 8-oxo-dGTPase [Marinobacter zhejiangensis]